MRSTPRGRTGRSFALISAMPLAFASVDANAQASEQSPPPAPQPSEAQADSRRDIQGLQEIIVTAEHREANVQRTPLAITAVGGDDLRGSMVTDVESLSSSVPNVTFGRNGGSSKVFIRGIGLDALTPGSDPRVAIYTDGVYNARSQAAFSGFYDIDRIEVLAGPQGTLYGRNATAGAVNIITKDPGETLDGFGMVTVGNYSLIRTEGAVGGPLADGVSARLAFQTTDRSGYGENIQTGEDVDDERSRAVRAKLLISPSSNFDILLAADYFNQDDHSGGYHYIKDTPGQVGTSIALGFTRPADIRDTAGDGPQQRLENYGFSATMTADLGGPELTSISAFRRFRQDLATTADATTSGYLPLFIMERARQFSQELRITHSIGPVDLLVGGYYFNERNRGGIGAVLSGAYFGFPTDDLLQGTLYGGVQRTTAYAAFAQATWRITDRLGLDVGIRYSDERRRINENTQLDLVNVYDPSRPFFEPDPAFAIFLTQRASWRSWDPKVTLHYQFTDRVFGYATFSQGFKSGGFNLGFLQPAFDPEDIKAYEVGLKADLFDRRLRANIAGFLYDYKNLQVNLTEGIVLVTRNAGAARLYGLEGQFTALPVDDLRITLNASWLHSKYTEYVTPDPTRPGQGDTTLPDGSPAFDLNGNQLAYAPKYKVDGEIAYTIRTGVGEFTPRVNVTWVDRVYFSQFNHRFDSQPSHAEVNVYLDFLAGTSGWSATAFVKNLTDKRYVVAETIGGDFLGFNIVGQLAPPRTFGLTVAKRF